MSKLIAVIMAKNEAHVIERCIASVSWCDGIYVADTGSTDNTPGVALRAGRELGVRTVVEHHDWVDFAHNRTAAFRGAEAAFEMTREDWLLMVDADDVVQSYDLQQILNIALKYELNADAIRLQVPHGGTKYFRPQIFRADGLWRWRCPVHEFAVRDGKAEYRDLKFVEYEVIGGGARSQDPDKYRRDAELIERTLANLAPEDEDLRPRLQFYLGQSLKDAGQVEKATQYLKERLLNTDGYWQERYMSAIYLLSLTESWLGKTSYAHDAIAIDHRRPEGAFWVAKMAVERSKSINCRNTLLASLSWAHYAATRPQSMPDALFYDPRTIEWAANLRAEIEAML